MCSNVSYENIITIHTPHLTVPGFPSPWPLNFCFLKTRGCWCVFCLCLCLLFISDHTHEGLKHLHLISYTQVRYLSLGLSHLNSPLSSQPNTTDGDDRQD